MSDVDNKLKRFIKQVNKPISRIQIERALHRIGSLLELKVKEKIVKKKLVDQGYLLNSIRYNVEMNQQGGSVTVGSYGVVYAAIHEFGGTILPKSTNKSGYLTFFSKRYNGWKRVKKVNIREKRYMRTGVENSLPRILRILEELGVDT